MDQDALIDAYIAKLDDASLITSFILEECVNDPNLFCFGEILDHPRVIQLEPDYSELIQILTTLAFGEWKDRKSLSLNPVIENKLKKLTLLSAFLEYGRDPVPFDHLLARAGIEDDIAIFHLLLSMTLVVSVRMDEINRKIRVTEFLIARDVHDSKIPSLLASVEKIKERVDALINGEHEQYTD